VTSDFLYELATLSISLVLTDCPLSGRGQGQASNFYILGLENFASKLSVYWRDQQTRRQSACGLHQRQSSTSWLNAQAYYMLVSCNPLTTLLWFVLDLSYRLFLHCYSAVGKILTDTLCRAVCLRWQSLLLKHWTNDLGLGQVSCGLVLVGRCLGVRGGCGCPSFGRSTCLVPIDVSLYGVQLSVVPSMGKWQWHAGGLLMIDKCRLLGLGVAVDSVDYWACGVLCKVVDVMWVRAADSGTPPTCHAIVGKVINRME